MKIRYIMDVKIPGEDYRQALELHRQLQGAVAEVFMDNGYTTDGLKAVRLDPADPAKAMEPKSEEGLKNLMGWIPTAASNRDKGKGE